MNIFNIQRAFKTMDERGWDKIFVLVDLHDTVFKGDYKPGSVGGKLYPKAKEVLQRLSKREDISLIMWTCSHGDIIKQTIEWFKTQGIQFDHANHNPECPDTPQASFRDKLYFNIIFDDKAGFEGEKDWKLVEYEFDIVDGLVDKHTEEDRS